MDTVVSDAASDTDATHTLSDVMIHSDGDINTLDSTPMDVSTVDASIADVSMVDAPTVDASNDCYGSVPSPIMYISTNTGRLYRANVDTNAISFVGQMSQPCTDLAYHASNRLICGDAEKFHWVNPDTADSTEIGIPYASGEAISTGFSMVSASDGWLYFDSFLFSTRSHMIARVRPESLASAEIVHMTFQYFSSGGMFFSEGVLYYSAHSGPNTILIGFPDGAPTVIASLPNLSYKIANRADGRAYLVSGNSIYDLDVMDGSISNQRVIGDQAAYAVAMRDEGCASRSP